MKSLFLSITMVFLLSGFRQMSIPSNEVMEWLSPKEHDFGDLEQGKAVTYYFEFKNTSEAPLTIDNVRPSCGCTAPDWSVEPIGLGEVGKVKIVFDAKQTGYFRKKIRVYFNQLRRAEVLYIEGLVLIE